MEFRILGPLEASEGGSSVSLGTEKQRAVLAVLLLNANRTVSLEHLVGEVWGDDPPPTAVKAIHTYVSRLRKVLPTGALRTSPPGYVLQVGLDELDLDQFVRLYGEGRQALAAGDFGAATASLREALALWRGPALAEFASGPLSLGEGARLEELRLSALEGRIDADLALGRHGELVAELESLVAHHPLRERLRGQLMLALYRSGRQADALAAYQEARRTLVDGLGIEPDRELQALERAILRHDPDLELPQANDDDAAAAVRTAVPGGGRGPFVGRERELERLLAALEDAARGRGRLVLLVGEAGIGKTRTMLELATLAGERGALALWGRCHEHEGAPPYWPWVQAIRAYAALCGSNQLREDLGAGAGAIAEVVPELSRRLPGIEPPPAADATQARFRLLDSLTSFLSRAAARQPLLLVLDDIHAADDGSLMLLEFVAHHMSATQLLIVCAYRDDAARRGRPLSQTLAELSREQLSDRLALRGLTEHEVGRYVEASIGEAPPAGLVEVAHARTEGNPLFVAEVVRLLGAEGRLSPAALAASEDWRTGVPEGVREVIGMRLDRLSGPCNETLRIAAVVGREFRLRHLTNLIGPLPDDQVLEHVEEALAARLVEEQAGVADGFRFTHGLVREVLRAEISTTRRVRLHARVACVLEELYGQAAAAPLHVAELAYHFAEAEAVLGPERLVHYSRLAGEQAFAAHAYDDAIAHFQRALTAKEGEPMDGETADLLVALVRSEFLGRQRYDLGGAFERLRQVFDYYVDAGETRRAVLLAAHPIPLVYGPTGVPRLLVRALDLVPPGSLDAGWILANIGWFAGTNDGDYEGANRAFERALDIARRYEDRALERRILIQAARVDWWHLQLDGSVAKSTRALELAQDAGDQQAELYARAWLVREAAMRGSSSEAQAHAAVSLELAERLRERYWLATARVNEFWLAYAAGDWEDARRESDAGLRHQPRDARNLGLRSLLEFELRDPSEGELYLERLLEGMRVTVPGSRAGHTEVALVMAFVSVITGVRGRFEEAEAAARTVLTSPVRFPMFELYARVGLAVMAVGRAEPASARDHYNALASWSETFLILVGMAADRVLGTLAVTMGELDAGCGHFEAALLFCERAGYRPEYARTAIDCAEALLDRDRPGDADRAACLRREGLAIADELGMRALTERAFPRGS